MERCGFRGEAPVGIVQHKGRYGGIAIRPVHARAEAPAIRLLISATKGSRAALSLRPPLVLHDPDGSFTPEAAASRCRRSVP
jgi:tRNA1(Val) A37 N6-methylase TrmN6